MLGYLAPPPIQTLSKSGSTISLTGQGLPTSSITDNNTTYSVATTSANGLLSASDKTALDKLKGVQPYFLVYYTGSGDTEITGTTVLKFNNVTRDTHSAYSTSTGKFTAPVAGIYLFNFNYYSNDATAPGSMRPCIHIDGADVEATVQMSSMSPGSLSVIARMPAGATAYVGPYNTTYKMNFYAGANHTSFSGTLLSYI